MALCDPPLHHCQEIVDCNFTKVVACRVGASFSRALKTREFACSKRKTLPCDAAASVRDIKGFLCGGEVSLRVFTLEELMEATNCFHPEMLLGGGGFGTIYRGRSPDGNSIAVKVVNCKKRHPDLLKQFEAEIKVGNLIEHGSHPNLVRVTGYHYSYSEEGINMIIVYPFMANGDLGRYFCDEGPSLTPPDWPTRKRIALSVARGIYSLHQLSIVHRDIKPSNVLLDENFEACVGDFGLAKFVALSDNSDDVGGLHDDVASRCHTRVCGTMGYMPPELGIKGQCSRKFDVYAYGVTLIQIVTWRPLFFALEDNLHCQSILSWADKHIKKKEDLTGLMHPNTLGMYDESEALELIQLGLVCAQRDPAKRPFMPEVIAIMEGSSSTLKQRWNDYDCRDINGLSSVYYIRTTNYN